MATLAFGSSGARIYISAGVPATFDGAGYAALAYTEILEVTEIGVIGEVFSITPHNPINDRNTYKIKTTKNTGSLSVKGAKVPADAGQVLLNTAAGSVNPYAIKIVLPNTAATTIYAQGLVLSYTTNIGTATSIAMFDSPIELSGGTVVV